MYPVTLKTPMLAASIGDLVVDGFSALMDTLGDFIAWLMDTTVVAWLTDTVLKNFVDSVLSLGDDLYNKLIDKAFQILTKNPKEWSASAWDVASRINDTLISTIGISLIVVFFAISFCRESLDPRQDLRFENILLMFIKLSVASWFMYNSIHIVASMFGLVDLVVGGSGFGSQRAGMREFFDTAYNQITGNGSICNGEIFGSVLLAAVVSLVFTASSILIGMLVVYQAFTRFFKILVIIPYGSIASTTIAGDHQLSQSAVSFYKYALNCVLEAATMAMAMFLFAKLSDKLPLGLFQEPATSLMDVSGRMFTELILMMTMYGVIKQSSAITQRALGL